MHTARTVDCSLSSRSPTCPAAEGRSEPRRRDELFSVSAKRDHGHRRPRIHLETERRHPYSDQKRNTTKHQFRPCRTNFKGDQCCFSLSSLLFLFFLASNSGRHPHLSHEVTTIIRCAPPGASCQCQPLNDDSVLSLTTSRQRLRESRARAPEGREGHQPDAPRVCDPIGEGWSADAVPRPPVPFQRLDGFLGGCRGVDAAR